MKTIFQIIDADYFLLMNKPIVRLFGRTESGNSICAFYEGFLPYFYVEPNEKTAKEMERTPEIVKTENVQLTSPLYYREDKTDLIKITLQNPQTVTAVRDKFLKSAKNVFEADILFKNRFLIDFGLHGMCWAEADVEKIFTNNTKSASYRINTIKQIDTKTNSDIRYMAFDIECVPSDPTKPLNPKTDPVVMISLAFSQKFRNSNTLVLVSKPFKGNNSISFTGEKEMLEQFLGIIDEFDPDIMTGYNLNSFDMPYIIDRLKQNGLGCFFGRTTDKPVYMKKFGAYEECIVPGRVVADPYQIIRKDPWMKFHRYTLNDVSKALLKEEKINIAYSDMPRLWNGSAEDLKRFVEYCRKDAELSLKLILDVGLLDKFIELSKISGILLQDCFGGQTQRIDNILLREFRKRGYVMPSKPSEERVSSEEAEALKGATVLEPKKGLHSEGCILILDFQSLYPNIMKTYNVSPDTLVTSATKKKTHKSPTGAEFLDAEEKEGILPFIARTLLDARIKTKKEMSTADEERRKILNARQLALKDLANSVYGYTGYARARLYVIDVANSITAYGRENIVKTKKLVEENFPAEVVYGDTDSIFVKTRIKNLDEAKNLGEEIADFVSGKLPGTLRLDFQKIYRTFLILTKKRYAGWKFVFDGKWKDEIEMKGIETVRRDWCPLVSETLKRTLDVILKEGDIKKAIDEVRAVLDKLKAGDIDTEKLTVMKGITKSVQSYEGMLPHIELAKKLLKRNPQNPPKIGDRIGFVIVRGNQMLSSRAEDPDYVERHNMQIDSDYYIHNQLLPPVERILNAVGITGSELLGYGRQMNINDIMNGSSRKMKHEIDFSDKLEAYEGFLCQSCKKQHRRMPLRGVCDCGGNLLLSYRGSVGGRTANA